MYILLYCDVKRTIFFHQRAMLIQTRTWLIYWRVCLWMRVPYTTNTWVTAILLRYVPNRHANVSSVNPTVFQIMSVKVVIKSIWSFGRNRIANNYIRNQVKFRLLSWSSFYKVYNIYFWIKHVDRVILTKGGWLHYFT